MELEGLQVDCTTGLEFKIILKKFIEEMTCKKSRTTTNRDKCKALHLCKNDHLNKYGLWGQLATCQLFQKKSGVVVGHELSRTQHSHVVSKRQTQYWTV